MKNRTGKTEIVAGTRGSTLALTQTEYVLSRIRGMYPRLECSHRIIKTTGDNLSISLVRGGQEDGLFTSAIERELLGGNIDCAVHSYKDLPSLIHNDLCIAALTGRYSPHDVLVSGKYSSLKEFPSGAVIGTSSPRRRALLAKHFPHIKTAALRGNVETRLGLLDERKVDGLILAHAGLTRLGLDERVSCILDDESWYYPPGQGVLALEIRKDDSEMEEICSAITDKKAEHDCLAEKEFARTLGAGCRTPFGVRISHEKSEIRVRGMISDTDGSTMLFSDESSDNPADAGRKAAQSLLKQGAREILKRTREI